LSERELARLWEDQTFPAEALVSTQGERLRVIYRGRRGGSAGPDFRDAVIAAPGRLLEGDVELHVRSGDFRRHGHERDPAYSRVVLHFVFEDDAGGPTTLPGGGSTAVVALAGWARGRAAGIQRWLERRTPWREPCFSSLGRYGLSEVGACLERLGDMRFRQKAAGFARRLHGSGGGALEKWMGQPGGGGGLAGADDVLWEAMLEALGYGGDRETFGLLAQRLPWSQLRARLASLPASGRAAEVWRLLSEILEPLSTLKRHGRPAGKLENRIKGAAQLAARFAPEGLLRRLAPLLEGDPVRGRRELIAAFTVPRYVGRERAVELVANAVLPWLAALGPEVRARWAEEVYRGLPITARYGAVKHLHEAVGDHTNGEAGGRGGTGAPIVEFGGGEGVLRRGGVRVNFRRQQGMLYLLNQYCTRGGCGRCPLS
jgi:hypothetical protein